MTDTLFSKIIRGEIPCHKVYEDDDTFAFLDIKPINPGHTLVVPKLIHETLFDLPEETFLAMMRTVHTLAPLIKKAVAADGINIGMNNLAAAGQEVPHAHIHIIPRFVDDGHVHWKGRTYREGEADEVLRNIHATIKA